MKYFWALNFLFLSLFSYPQDHLTQVLEDPSIIWAALSEIKINLEDEKISTEQSITGDYNWVSFLKVDMAYHPDLPPDKYLSRLIVDNLTTGNLTMYVLETHEALKFQDIRKELISIDTFFYTDSERFDIYRYELPVERLFDYFVLKQLWYYNQETHTFHNHLLGIIPVHVHPDYSGGKEAIHQKLGWIPFSSGEKKRVDINNPTLIWIRRATSYALFSDWKIIKGETFQFVKEYFFELPNQGKINISYLGSNIPLRPPIADVYIEKTRNEKIPVFFDLYNTYVDVKEQIANTSPVEIEKIIGFVFDQFLYFENQTSQMGSSLDLVGPLRDYYIDEGMSEYESAKILIYAPIYYILNPSNNEN